MKKEYIIEIISNNYEIFDASVTLDVEKNAKGIQHTLKLNCVELGEIIKKGFHICSVFVELRKEVEKNNFYLLCKGCLVNTYPLGRSKNNMTYSYIMGKRVQSVDDMVNIFAPIKISELFSIERQKDYYQMWLKSIEDVSY